MRIEQMPNQNTDAKIKNSLKKKLFRMGAGIAAAGAIFSAGLDESKADEIKDSTRTEIPGSIIKDGNLSGKQDLPDHKPLIENGGILNNSAIEEKRENENKTAEILFEEEVFLKTHLIKELIKRSKEAKHALSKKYSEHPDFLDQIQDKLDISIDLLKDELEELEEKKPNKQKIESLEKEIEREGTEFTDLLKKFEIEIKKPLENSSETELPGSLIKDELLNNTQDLSGNKPIVEEGNTIDNLKI